jgi:diguanylate cyclase (GGDEF)-like protein/PAS domain S-box-containing protein
MTVNGAPGQANAGRILVVDDTPENLAVLTQLLRSHDYQVRSALSGKRALQLALNEAPDLMLLDIRMPEMDGYEVCWRFKERPELRGIPIIFISALTDTEVKVRTFTSGGVDFISKPFDAEEVLARVRTHLTLHAVEQELDRRLAVRTRELAESETRYRTLIEKSPNVLYSLSPDHGHLYANRRFREILGAGAEWFREVPERWWARIHPDDQVRVRAAMTEAPKQGRHYDLEYRILDAAGQWRWFHDQSIDIRTGPQGTIVDSLATDITETRKQQAVMEHLAYHDLLTDLANRKKLLASLDSRIAAAEPFALLLLDLDRFKDINDALGHAAGDLLLLQLAQRLRSQAIGATDLVARLGGDEFLLCLGGADLAAARTAAAGVLASFEQPFSLEGLRVKVGASIGIVAYPTDDGSASELLMRADVAMYAAKRRLGGYACYTSDSGRHSAFRLELLSEFSEAIDQGQLRLYYQPKIRLSDDSVSGVEALVRWQHPRHGLLPPSEFLPMVETSDVIGKLTRWVITAAALQLQCWYDRGLCIPIAVNLSARNLVDDGLADWVADVLERYRVPAGGLEFEITETAMMLDIERTLATLDCIARLNVGFAIDDFGTGFSSFSFVRRLPHLASLKIDRSFVAPMRTNPVDAVVVNSMISLARGLGVTAIAEGVEDDETLEALRLAGCPEAQGYVIARPMPVDQAEHWLLERGRRNAP